MTLLICSFCVAKQLHSLYLWFLLFHGKTYYFVVFMVNDTSYFLNLFYCYGTHYFFYSFYGFLWFFMVFMVFVVYGTPFNGFYGLWSSLFFCDITSYFLNLFYCLWYSLFFMVFCFFMVFMVFYGLWYAFLRFLWFMVLLFYGFMVYGRQILLWLLLLIFKIFFIVYAWYTPYPFVGCRWLFGFLS